MAQCRWSELRNGGGWNKGKWVLQRPGGQAEKQRSILSNLYPIQSRRFKIRQLAEINFTSSKFRRLTNPYLPFRPGSNAETLSVEANCVATAAD